MQPKPMLREYLYIKDWTMVETAVQEFITLPRQLELIGFGDITPDSFIWKLYDVATETFYYLYAEDYVQNLAHVRAMLKKFANDVAVFDLLPVKNSRAFEDTSPNRAARVYQPPDSEYDFMHYAAQSGYDFVFLARSDEKMSDFSPSVMHSS